MEPLLSRTRRDNCRSRDSKEPVPFYPFRTGNRVFSLGSEDVKCVFQSTKRKSTTILTILWFHSDFDTSPFPFSFFFFVSFFLSLSIAREKMVRKSCCYSNVSESIGQFFSVLNLSFFRRLKLSLCNESLKIVA